MLKSAVDWWSGVPRTVKLSGVLYVALRCDIPVETRHVVMAWISGTGTYVLVSNYNGGRETRFPAGVLADEDFDGDACRAFCIDADVPAQLVVNRPAVSIGVCLLADWGIPAIATRTRTIIGAATIHITCAVAAAHAGAPATAAYMTRVGSSVPVRAACAVVPGGSRRPEDRLIAIAVSDHVRKAMASARTATHEWVRAVMRGIDSMPHINEATAHLKTARWETHLGVLPPELYFAPHYPETGPFCERSYARALERARFVTGGVSPAEVLKWCTAADQGARLCACTLLGRMLAAFGLCIAYTPDVLLHPMGAEGGRDALMSSIVGVQTEYVDHYTNPSQTMTGDCDETAKVGSHCLATIC